MSTRSPLHTAVRIAVAFACLAGTAGCGGELLRTGRSPVFLTIDTMSAARGSAPASFTSTLLSDVQTLVDTTINGTTVRVPTVYNDLGRATISVALKSSGVPGSPAAPTALNAVTLTRYRVSYRRSDGRNQPGIDVPFAIDGGVTLTIPAGGSGVVVFDLVRHAAKSEPPLRNLVDGGGLRFISTVADITFYGRDQNGNELMVTGLMDITFADFGDDD